MLLSLIIEKHKTDLHLPEENYNRSLVRQLGWITEQTRTDLAFHACQLSSQLNKSTRDSILKANKLLAIAEKKNVLIGIGKHRSIKNFETVCKNEASLGKLKDGGSYRCFIIHLVDEDKVSSPIMQKSKEIHRIVKKAMKAETLKQVESAEVQFWLANLLDEILYNKPNREYKIKTE